MWQSHVAAGAMGKKRGLDWRKVNWLGLLVESLGLLLPEISGSGSVSYTLNPILMRRYARFLRFQMTYL